MFEFEGDWYNAASIVAIIREDADVKIFVYASDDPFLVECEDEDDAIKRQTEAVAAWRKAFNPQ